ncbi:hypothetical protein PINS_up005336 [Pythium insidiosum]|nr:hypothetical protein PINS_up005336 [Pythium insidiosum]
MTAAPQRHAALKLPMEGMLGEPDSPVALSHGSRSLRRQLPQQRRRRELWRLDLSPLSKPQQQQQSPGGHRWIRDSNDVEPEEIIAAHITSDQADRKSFKTEPWYHSPIGHGSVAAVVMTSLKQEDAAGKGVLPYDRLVQVLQRRHFGLTEEQARRLVAKYDPHLTRDSPVNIKTFVQHLHLSQSNPVEEELPDTKTRQQSYIDKVRQHANRLVDIANRGSPSPRSPLSPVHLSPLREPPPRVTNNEPDVIVGSSPMHSPSRLAPLERRQHGIHASAEGDLLSFENDKRRKEMRANARARILLSHINRIEEYARQHDSHVAQQETLRIANKALAHSEHLSKQLEYETQYQRRLERQGKKGLLDCDLRREQRNVSKASMFYLNPD